MIYVQNYSPIYATMINSIYSIALPSHIVSTPLVPTKPLMMTSR